MRFAYQINMLQLAWNHNAICVFLMPKCSWNRWQELSWWRAEAGWHLEGPQAKMWPGGQGRKLHLGPLLWLSWWGFKVSSGWGGAEKKLSPLEVWGPSGKKGGYWHICSFSNHFVNWPLKGNPLHWMETQCVVCGRHLNIFMIELHRGP